MEQDKDKPTPHFGDALREFLEAAIRVYEAGESAGLDDDQVFDILQQTLPSP